MKVGDEIIIIIKANLDTEAVFLREDELEGWVEDGSLENGEIVLNCKIIKKRGLIPHLDIIE